MTGDAANATADRATRKQIAFVIGLLVLGFAAAIGGRSLWTPDEPRVAEIGRAMLATGDYVVPKLAHEAFLEKPPLGWWAMALSYRLFGVSEGAARAPSILFAALTLLLVFDMARRIGGSRAGLFAIGALVTLANFHNMLRVLTDPALAFFVTLGYWSFLRCVFPTERDDRGARSPTVWIPLVHVAGGLAFLSKGIVGVVVLFGPLGIYLLATRRWSLLLHRAQWLGALLLVSLCAVWPYLLYQRGGTELLDGFLVDNVLLRLLGASEESSRGGHKHPFYYYLARAPLDLLPWLFAVPALVRYALQRARTHPARGDALVFVASVFPIGVLLLSVPGTKRLLYLLPLAPSLAVALGVWLHATCESRAALDLFARRAMLVVFVVLVAGLGLAGVGLLLVRGGLPAADAIERMAHAGPMTPWLAVALVVCAALLLLWLRRSVRASGPSGAVVLLAWCMAWTALQVFAFPLVDPLKDMRPLVHEMRTSGAFDRPIVGFNLDETTPAVVGFYAGTTLPTAWTIDELRAWLDAHPGGRVLVLDRKADRLMSRDGDAPTVLVRWTFSARRTYLLLDGAAL